MGNGHGKLSFLLLEHCISFTSTVSYTIGNLYTCCHAGKGNDCIKSEWGEGHKGSLELIEDYRGLKLLEYYLVIMGLVFYLYKHV